MVKVKKGKLEFEVATELQAAAFLKNGWQRVESKKTGSTNSETEKTQSKSKE